MKCYAALHGPRLSALPLGLPWSHMSFQLYEQTREVRHNEQDTQSQRFPVKSGLFCYKTIVI